MKVYAQILPKKYIAYKTEEEIQIDGDDSDIPWKKIEWSDSFLDIEGSKKPKFDTKVKMLWDTSYFYILAQMEEPHVWANLIKHDTIVFHNNNFEVFIDPDGDTYNYYEIEINALGTVWDLFLTKPYRENSPVLNDWEAQGAHYAIKINGTLNNPKDIDQGWTVEMAIPWKVFKTSYFHKNVPIDKFWRFNFSRVNWNFQLENGKYSRKKDKKGELLSEYNWVWSPTGVINMHEPEKWGYVYFSSKRAGEQAVFEIPKDEKIKWKLFELYRLQKAYFKKNKSWIHSLEEMNANNITINNKRIKFLMENHSQGYNIIVRSPFTGKTLVIREDGHLTSSL